MRESLMIDNNFRGQNEKDFKNGFLEMAKAFYILEYRKRYDREPKGTK